MLISIVVEVHPDAVKVYVDVPIADVLIIEGVHVPVILLLDVFGSNGAVEF
jgi:hypothetical protein